ncbi:MAG: hypothetical protein P1V20_12240 [Verrucomicrobiales bacterium]|nr:hypothetical protein [Verrucomicrobiales bacterium]
MSAENNPERPEMNQPTFEDLASEPDPQVEVSPPVQAAIVRRGKDLVLIGNATLSSQICIKSGKAPNSVISVGIRSPFKPQSWFGGHKAVIGLDRSNQEKFRIQQTVAFALIGLGALMIPVGFFSGITTSIAGLVLLLAGFVCRSVIPVWSPQQAEGEMVVRGCGESYLAHFPESGNEPGQVPD